MSDISIPGVTNSSRMDTNQMVEDLMEIERIPVRRLETRVETFNAQNDAWQALGRQLSQLRDTARAMYGFENPFRDRVAETSDPAVVTATASREAFEGSEEITVLQTAGSDRFASSSLARDFEVPAGRYGFRVGDDEETFRFAGGSLREFASQVNDRMGDHVRLSVIPDTATTTVLVIQAQEEGAAQRLGFTEDAVAFSEQIGLMSPPQGDRTVTFLDQQPLQLEPETSRELAPPSRAVVADGMVLRYEIRITEEEREPWTPPPAPPGATLPDAGSVAFEGIVVQNEGLGFDLPPLPDAEEPPFVEDNAILTVASGGQRVALPAAPQSGEFVTVEIPAADLPATVDRLIATNRNTHRTVELRNVRLLDPAARDGAIPLRPLDQARDARIEYNGIEIGRDSNEVDDLIPGVTINLRRASDEPVTVSVAPNRDAAKDAIINFVGFYNQVIRDTNIYTRTDRDIIDQIDYFTDDERETMEERLGIFQGDTGINQLRTSLQTVMMEAYGDGGDPVRLLAEIGISTNASGAGGFDPSRLRGYLEIDENALDTALEQNFDAVGRLFGRDSDGDLVTDTGVAFAVNRYVTPYVQTGGIIASRSGSLDTRVSSTQDQIERYNDRLEDYETQLRTEFGQMEGALQSLEEQGRAFENLGTQGNR